MEQTAQQLGQMAELARAQAGDSAAQLFETHAMFLEDEDYTGAMEELLAEGILRRVRRGPGRGAVFRHAGGHGRPLYAGPRLRRQGRHRAAF